MNGRKRTKRLLGQAGLAVLAIASTAQAGGFAIREQGAYWQGMSFAGAAAGGSVGSMFWNPATLSDVTGFQSQTSATFILPEVNVDLFAPPIATDEGDIGINALVPSSFYAYRLTDRLVAGMGVNGPFGLATQYGDFSPLRTFGVAGTSRVFSLNANPSLSYDITDWLSVGAGAQIQYIDLHYTAQSLPGLPLPATASLNGDDIGFGFTAGVQAEPFAGTQIGLGYRSRINHELDGEVTLEPADIDIDATAEDFDLPDLVTFGVRQRITDAFRVSAGVEWANWSRFDTVTIKTPAQTIPLSFDYDDGWFFSAGGEYDLNQRATVRAGIGYELSPIDDDNRTYRLPDSDRLWLSAGASYKLTERFTVDLGYTFIKADEANILSVGGGGPPVNGPFSGEADAHVHIVAVGIRSKFGGAPQLFR